MGGRQVWFDRDVLRLNYDNRGEYLGEFQSEDSILVVSGKGTFYTSNFDLNNHYEKDILVIEKFDSNKVWTVALWDAEQKFYYLKRFQLEASVKPQNFLGDNADSRLMLMSDVDFPRLEVVFGGNDAYREALVVDAEEFIGVKSFKAKGKRLTTFEVETINELDPVRFAPAKEQNPDGGDDKDNVEQTSENEDVMVDAPVGSEAKETENTNNNVVPEAVAGMDDTKNKKAKTSAVVQNDTVLPDEIIDQNRIIDDITGQLTLF